MKRVTTLTFITLIIYLFSQSALAQKMPFQGRLMENGNPFTGSVNIVFEIEEISWIEAHNNVLVSEGLYSLVLGSTSPLPAALFAGVDSRQLKITVNGTVLDPVSLYPAFTGNNFARLVNDESGHTTTVDFSIEGSGQNGFQYNSIRALSSTQNGVNTGVLGMANSSENSSGVHYGMRAAAFGNGTGNHFGLFASSSGPHNNYGVLSNASGLGHLNFGVRSIAFGEGNGATGYHSGSYNTGVSAVARGNSWGNVGVDGRATNDPTLGGKGVDNIGVIGWSYVNDETTTISNTGVIGRANGPGRNVGVLGHAHSGSENWAGWFDGDVKVTGTLDLDQNLRSLNYIVGHPAMGSLVASQNPDGGYWGANLHFSGGVTAEGNHINGGASIGNKWWEPNAYLGYVHVNGNNPDKLNVGRLEARNFGGPDHGYLEVVNTENNSRVIVNGHPGEVLLFGPDSPNFILQPQHWHNHNLPILNMYGNEPNGNGWYNSHVEISVDLQNNENFGQFRLKGPNNKNNFWIGAKHWEGANGSERPIVVLFGSNDQNRVTMSVETGNTETGAIYVDDNQSNKLTLMAGSLNTSNSNASSAVRLYSHIDGANTSHIALDGANGNYVYLFGNGSVQTTGAISATAFNQTSDAELKTNISPLESTLNNVIKLQGVSYNWKDTLLSSERQMGFVAQQVEEIYPEFVSTREDGVKTVNYAQMTSVLVESIKELHNRINQLEQQNQQLASQLVSQQQLTQEITLLKSLMMDIIARNSGQEINAPSSTSENISILNR